MRNDYLRSARTVRRCDALMRALVPVLITLVSVAPLVLLGLADPPATEAAVVTEAKRLREERDEALRNERVALEQLGVECEAKHDWQAAHEAMTEERDALVEQVNYRAETEE